MKKPFIIILTISFILAGIVIYFVVTNRSQQVTSAEQSIDTTPPISIKPTDQPTDQLATEILAHMTLEQKIGQMLIIRNEYTSMTEAYANEISQIQPGGYIIFNVNITTLSDTKRLISNSRNQIAAAGSVTLDDGTPFAIPAILSVDQEGGIVQRLQSISDYPPEYISPMSEVGASGSTDTAYNTGRLLAEQCQNLGLNVDYAPVADIFSNPDNTIIGNRAFGTDKTTVATMATALARGLRDHGVTPVFKHFPGHGDTITDSHLALPVVTKTLDELYDNELYPFQQAIKSGAEMIMVAHIALPNVTGDYTPASLSPAITSDLLRDRLHYDGLIITDGLDMGAVTKNYSVADIATKAILAGADLLLTPLSPLETKTAIQNAVNDGTIPLSRIDASVLRILQFKLQYLD